MQNNFLRDSNDGLKRYFWLNLETGEKMNEKMEYPKGLFEYFLVEKFDMCGGDFYKAWSDYFQQAYLECI